MTEVERMDEAVADARWRSLLRRSKYTPTRTSLMCLAGSVTAVACGCLTFNAETEAVAVLSFALSAVLSIAAMCAGVIAIDRLRASAPPRKGAVAGAFALVILSCLIVCAATAAALITAALPWGG